MIADSASAQAGISDAGSASEMLPPIVPRLRIAGWATCATASVNSGKCAAISGSPATSAWRVVAPMMIASPSRLTPRSAA